MKFKSLLLNGFKSFADKIIIDFPPGVTCVVGPNGSGKSNILDAIRWVFGEQSPKELRGNDMDDVIFAGTTVRKPSGFGEVTLTVSDIPESISGKWGTFSEISITRRHYRDGEREYLINGRKCKLKDIKEIFYDTGIGAKSISIIEQGRVEKIIQSTPEELRIFFEETAGIMKFKERKKEAEKRLKQTRDNLNRLNDIITEVKKQRDGLLSQLTTLKTYRSLKEKLENLEVSYYSNSYFNELGELKKLSEHKNSLKLDITSHIKELENFRKSEEETKIVRRNLETKMTEINNSVIININNINELDTEVKLLKNNLQSAEHTKTQLKNDIELLQTKLREYSENSKKAKDEIDSFEMELESENERLSELTEEIEELNYQKESISDELSELKTKFVELTQTITSHRNEIFKLETEIRRLEKDISNMENERNSQSEMIKDIEPELLSLREKRISIKDDIDMIKTKLESLSVDLNYKKKSRDDLLSNLNKLKIERASKEADIKNLNAQIDNIIYGDGNQKRYFDFDPPKLFVDFVSQLDDGIKKIHSDLLIFNKKDKNAVLDSVGRMDYSLKFSFEDEVDTILKDIATKDYDEYNNNLFKFGHIYYKLGKDNKNRLVVELKENLEKTTLALEHIVSDIEKMESSESVLKSEIEGLKVKSVELENSKVILEKELITVESKILNYEQELNKIHKRLEIIDNENKFNVSEMKRKSLELEKIKFELDASSDKHLKLEEDIDTIEERIAFYDEKIDDKREISSELRTNIALINEKISSGKKSLYSYEKEITNFSSSMSSLKHRLDKLLTVDITGWNLTLGQKTELLKEAIHQRSEIDRQKQYTSNELQSILKTLEDFSKKIDGKSKIIKNIESEINAIDVKLAQIKQNISNLKDIFYDKTQKDLTDIYENYIFEDFKSHLVKVEIKQTEVAIQELGALNLAAENEYNEVNDRYEFLSKQKEDLENAYSSINEVINEIDQNSIRNFSDTFHQVNENFKKVFKILFGDGVAELKLSEPDNMLNTGVEIFVQPPGKKLQNMNLLSGGEKAMTACTLIFGMFLCKPTPFCFLDEIDAPLDDANISRFTKIIKELSNETQFLIITHNQKTMEAANSLYGVTMEEPGVSKIISVRLY